MELVEKKEKIGVWVGLTKEALSKLSFIAGCENTSRAQAAHNLLTAIVELKYEAIVEGMRKP